MTTPPTSSVTFACDMSALTAEQRTAHAALMNALFGAVVSIVPVERGYDFLVPPEPRMLARVGEFIGLERLCCPFFDCALQVPSGSRFATLQVTGPVGVEPFIQAEFGHMVRAGMSFPPPAP